MSNRQGNLFEGRRMQMTESIAQTVEVLRDHGAKHRDWSVGWSMGKDSSAALTLLVYLMDKDIVPRPKGQLTVLSSDTRMELLPLMVAGSAIKYELEERGIEVRTVMAPLDQRFFVYMLGKGVAPPNSKTLRYCTRMLKIDPMVKAMNGGTANLLMINGLRVGESATRDRSIKERTDSIVTACSRDGAECGAGYLHNGSAIYEPAGISHPYATLAPILHWRVCHVWEWLRHWAPQAEFGDWSTEVIADAYGGEESEEINARTGCVGCNLVEEDRALNTVIKSPRWAYLAPLQGLRKLYAELTTRRDWRLRKPGGEKRKDGILVKNQHRVGPLIMSARLYALEKILRMQEECNVQARRTGMPLVDILNAEEEARIRELIAIGTWPEKWNGEEPTADEISDEQFADGTSQPLLPLSGLVRRKPAMPGLSSSLGNSYDH